jgi:hypothetical protein
MSLGMKLMAPMEQVRDVPCLVDSFYERMFLYSSSVLLPILLFIVLTLVVVDVDVVVRWIQQSTRTPAPATPLTPPPVASPPLIWKQQEQEHFSKPTASSISDSSGSSSHWIVAYGYTTRDELDELMDLLGAYGPTLQTHANGNWLAVHYEGRLAAEKALCRQPIRLSSLSLCGTVRASQQLLQGLLAEPPVPLMSTNDSNANNNSSTHRSTLTMTHTTHQRFSSLQEEDILAHHASDGRTNEQGSLSRRLPTSVCEKFFSWYFAWDKDDDKEAKPHLD